MNKLLFFFLLPCLVLLSCKNEKKEKYLIQVNATLDREINWIYDKIKNQYNVILKIYAQEGQNPSLSAFVSNASTIYNRITKLKAADSIANTSKEIDLFSSIERKNIILRESLVTYDTISKIYERIIGNDFEYNQTYKVITIPKNVHLRKNEALKAEIQLSTVPKNFHPDWEYQTYINNKPTKHNNGIAEFQLSGDSTQKMKPGKYKWNGNIEMTVNGMDSSFEFTETFYVIPACK